MVSLTVNGESQQFDGDPNMPLLWYLRDQLGLTGSKYGAAPASAGRAPSTSQGSRYAPA